MSENQQIRSDCAYIELYREWRDGHPEVVAFEPEPKKYDAAMERVSQYALRKLNEGAEMGRASV